MPISIAKAALMYAKNSTSLGTNNQGFGQLSAPSPNAPKRDGDTRRLASERIQKLKLTPLTPGCSMDEVLGYGRKVSREQAGNCVEQCAAAAVYLTGQSDCPYFNLVSLAAPADHVFIVLSERPDDSGDYPMNFNNWSDDAVIVDPWVGVTCSAKDYPIKWKAALTAFASLGGEIAGAMGWKKASHVDWMNAVTANGKVSFCR